MRLQSIEEVDVAAPRLADAIVHGVPLVETEKVDNLVGAETRQPKSKPGKVHFALGLIGMAPPLGDGLGASPGLILDTHYETGNQRLELGGSFRFGVGSGGDQTPNSSSVIFSLGGRYFTSDTDFSPYVGGGLSWELPGPTRRRTSRARTRDSARTSMRASRFCARTTRTSRSACGSICRSYALNNNGESNYSPATGTYTTTSQQTLLLRAALDRDALDLLTAARRRSGRLAVHVPVPASLRHRRRRPLRDCRRGARGAPRPARAPAVRGDVGSSRRLRGRQRAAGEGRDPRARGGDGRHAGDA